MRRPRRQSPSARRFGTWLAGLTVALAGCGDHQDVFDSRTDTGDRVTRLGWIMLVVAGVVFVLVLVLLARALLRQPDDGGPGGDAPALPSDEPRRRFLLSSKGWIAVGGIAVPTVVVVALSALTIGVLDAGEGRGDLEIHVTGFQYWWEVEYPGPGGGSAGGFATANEIHVPVGQTTVLRLDAADVIHSLWVPELGPKRDMIPGHTTELRWTPTSTGTFRGQCAEFCGLQHANMAFTVTVDTPGDFDAWVAAQARPAAPPSGDLEAAGRQAFLDLPCSACHEIRGVNERPEGITLNEGEVVVGPDLTHVGSRARLGAETVINDPRHMAEWLADAQQAKPGNRMPPIPMTDEQLAALVAYLEGLR